MIEVIFSHGKESGPWGTKIKRLAQSAEQLGCRVESIDYTDTMDPAERSQRLLNYLKGKPPEQIILVGSSMGGYVTLQAAKNFAALGVFVLAPAIYMPGYEHQAPTNPVTNLVMVHGWHDDVIPVEHSIRFAKAQSATLHLVADDHRLVDSLDTIDSWFQSFLHERLS